VRTDQGVCFVAPLLAMTTGANDMGRLGGD
jgi:hypothetical protein